MGREDGRKIKESVFEVNMFKVQDKREWKYISKINHCVHEYIPTKWFFLL